MQAETLVTDETKILAALRRQGSLGCPDLYAELGGAAPEAWAFWARRGLVLDDRFDVQIAERVGMATGRLVDAGLIRATASGAWANWELDDDLPF